MRKLEIGCDNKRLDESWETLDILEGINVDIVADISQPLTTIEDNTYDLIYMSHILEHIAWYKTIDVLKEIRRISKVGGVLEVFVPDIDKIISAYQKEIIPDEWYRFNPDKNPFLWFVGRIFTYGNNDTDFHRAAFNKKHLKECLENAGFNKVESARMPRGVSHGYINLGMKGIK